MTHAPSGVLLEYPAPAEDAPAPATRTVLPGAKTPAVRKEERGTKRRMEIGFATTRATIAVGESLLSGRPERVLW
jgi:hypothetical protein